jgi:putative nucleotidyltransferase with HDIG domain
MTIFKSLAGEKSRKVFLAFFALSSVLPLLIMVLFVHQYLQPLIDADGSGSFGEMLAYGLLMMLFLPLLSFFLMFRWIQSLERLTQTIRLRSTEVNDGRKNFGDQVIGANEALPPEGTREGDEGDDRDEIQSLIHSFNMIFQTAADQLAEREHMKELLASLIALASDLTSELDSSRLFPLIISRVTTVMAVERTSLYVIDWDKRELWTKVAEGIGPITVPLGKGISGRVAETGETINATDAWDLPYFDRSFDQVNDFRTRSVLSVPVKNPTGQMIGVLQVINKIDSGAFDQRDEIFMKGLASQVGIALENSFLVDEARLSFNSSISTLSAIVDARHPLTAGHSQRVTEYSLLIARQMKLERNDIEVLRLAALLHDIGKIGIRDAVLLKDGVITDDERQEMNSHPIKTRVILEKFHFPRNLSAVPEIASWHHEKIDGRGYPEGLTGDRIPVGSKIIAVADVFDALTSLRDYPKYDGDKALAPGAMPLQQAISILQNEAGTHFAPEVVNAFLRCLPRALNLYRGTHFAPEYVDEVIRRLAPEILFDDTARTAATGVIDLASAQARRGR